MPTDTLYSIRMRASSGARHISGAESIERLEGLMRTVDQHLLRARSRSISPDRIVITVERFPADQVFRLQALDVKTVRCFALHRNRDAARHLLMEQGISAVAVDAAIGHISEGPSSAQSVMRGALLVDARTGERFERDLDRGVRVSRFGWCDSIRPQMHHAFAQAGLKHLRTREAVALATKVAHAPGIVAELCWSDEPDYTAGYIASLKAGYVRFPVFKESGNPKGGRAFFVDLSASNLALIYDYLERTPVLINELGRFSSTQPSLGRGNVPDRATVRAGSR